MCIAVVRSSLLWTHFASIAVIAAIAVIVFVFVRGKLDV